MPGRRWIASGWSSTNLGTRDLDLCDWSDTGVGGGRLGLATPQPPLKPGDAPSRLEAGRVFTMSQMPPETGNPAIDTALARVADAMDMDIAAQAQRLGEAQAVLQDVLRTSRQATQASASDR